MKLDLNSFIDWVAAGECRSAEIKVGEIGNNKKIEIWVYDYSLPAGQFVTSVDEINLEQTLVNRLESELKSITSRLKAIRDEGGTEDELR